MSPRRDVRVGVLGLRWWSLAFRGATAIVFGALVLAFPRALLPTLVALWGSFAFGDGIAVAVLATCAAGDRLRWDWLAFEALVSLATGVVAFFSHDVTALSLSTGIAAWAVSTAYAEVVGAVRLRPLTHGERVLATLGIVASASGAVLLATVGPCVLAHPLLIDGYVVVFGALLIALGAGVHRWSRS